MCVCVFVCVSVALLDLLKYGRLDVGGTNNKVYTIIANGYDIATDKSIFAHIFSDATICN